MAYSFYVMAKDGRGLFPLLVSFALAGLISGCGPSSPPMMPTWTAREQSYTPETPSTNAYDYYAIAAKDAEEAAGEALLNRVYFDEKHRKELLEKIGKPVDDVVAATSKKCQFRYTSPPLFEAAPYQRGWLAIGRALKWKIEYACATGAYDQAITYSIAATKFGFDITGGGATDASLGFEIADDARRAIAPHLGKFGAGQLAVLADGLENALKNKPSLETTIENEHTRMLEGVQFVQDAYAKDNFDLLMDTMKESVRDGVQYLRDLKSQDAKKRPAYFEGFAREADEQTRYLKTIAQMPARTRATEPGPKLADVRPWKSFAKQLFSSVEPLLKISDDALARTRLEVLTCQILRQIKASGSAPKNLKDFPADLTMDPYTGQPFAYRVSGAIFDIYSVGEDGIDNLGDTDEGETYSSPDLKLER